MTYIYTIMGRDWYLYCKGRDWYLHCKGRDWYLYCKGSTDIYTVMVDWHLDRCLSVRDNL